jgi:hypothetical protein
VFSILDGFRKVSHIEHGIKDENDDLEFQHMYFRRDQEHLLDKIKRKIAGVSIFTFYRIQLGTSLRTFKFAHLATVSLK